MQEMSVRALEGRLKNLRLLQERILASMQDYLTVVGIQQKSMVTAVNGLVEAFNKEVADLTDRIRAMKDGVAATRPGREGSDTSNPSKE